jgi:hypothetical protein
MSARSPRFASVAAAALLLAACGGGESASVARAPARSGDVWELDRAEDRATAQAALLAYVNGLHVMVLDGNTAYAGMTRLEAAKGTDGNQTLTLANGLKAELVRAGEAVELRFSSGELVPLRKRVLPDK